MQHVAEVTVRSFRVKEGPLFFEGVGCQAIFWEMNLFFLAFRLCMTSFGRQQLVEEFFFNIKIRPGQCKARAAIFLSSMALEQFLYSRFCCVNFFTEISHPLPPTLSQKEWSVPGCPPYLSSFFSFSFWLTFWLAPLQCSLTQDLQ